MSNLEHEKSMLIWEPFFWDLVLIFPKFIEYILQGLACLYRYCLNFQIWHSLTGRDALELEVTIAIADVNMLIDLFVTFDFHID